LAQNSTAASAGDASIGTSPLLKVTELSVSYGSINALKKVSIEVFPREIVVLIGANGAGKTTLLSTILGINAPLGGTVEFNGRRIDKVPADRNVRSGVCLVPEGRGVFASMSVLDNLLLGAHHNLAKQGQEPRPCLRVVPDPQDAQGSGGQDPFGRRTADARHRPGPHVGAQAHHGGRTLDRTRAHRGERHLQHPQDAEQGGIHHPPFRAERQQGTQVRPPGATSWRPEPFHLPAAPIASSTIPASKQPIWEREACSNS